MNRSLQSRWLMRGAALLAVCVGLVSMDVQRFGWGFQILCLLAGSLGGLGFLWVRHRLFLSWEQLSKGGRVVIIALGAALVVVGSFIANRHKPDEDFYDVMACIGVLAALALFGLYRIMSHFLDRLHARLSKH